MARAKKSKSKLSELEGQPDPRAALDSAGLLSACQGVLARLEADLLERTKASAAVTRALEARYEAEKKAERTAESFAGWTALLATQVAAAWVLSCVFVRTLEDRGLLKQARLAGPGAEDSQRQFFQLAPSLTERDYLLTVFRELAHHPAAKDLFDAKHSPIWKLSPSAAAAKELLALFRMPNATTPAFRFGQSSTRFLGDLYQDISEDVRKRYALLQTPDFIESFILDRTLEPAIQWFGLDDTTLIDPTCGSGHFLLGAFDRLFDHRLRAEPGVDVRIAAVKALDCVYGADINPYAVAIARFRLTLSFLEKAGYAKLADAPALPLHLVVADSLRINAQHPQGELWHQEGVSAQGWLGEVFSLEDEKTAKEVLFRQYAAVVGNPPYITVKDASLRLLYRGMYPTAEGDFPLYVPFVERFFQLSKTRGCVGVIVGSAFAKAQFGEGLVTRLFPAVNIDMIVNASNVMIPGHGTPTMLLFGQASAQVNRLVWMVTSKPLQRGAVRLQDQWQEIVENCNKDEHQSEIMEVRRVRSEDICSHPWLLAYGSERELVTRLSGLRLPKLKELLADSGRSTVPGEDEIWLADHDTWGRRRLHGFVQPLAIGESVRDYDIETVLWCLYPYGSDHGLLDEDHPAIRFLWPWRSVLANRKKSGKKVGNDGRPWWGHMEYYPDRIFTDSRAAYSRVGTHIHVAVVTERLLFDQTALMLISRDSNDTQRIVGYLGSSFVTFWLKHHCLQKSNASQSHSSDPSRQSFEFSLGRVGDLPVVNIDDSRLQECLMGLNTLARHRREWLTGGGLSFGGQQTAAKIRKIVIDGWLAFDACTADCCALQREIDEIVVRAVAKMICQPGEILDINGIAATLARPEYERQWRDTEKNVESLIFRERFPARHAVSWLHSRLEACVRNLATDGVVAASVIAADVSEQEVSVVAELVEVDSLQLVRRVLSESSVPYCAGWVFTDAGINKFRSWETAWADMRRGMAATVAECPRFVQSDFAAQGLWELRGKWNVPNERFIAYPGCESDNDGEPVYGWAGWDHLQRAKALASLYLNRKDGEGWAKDRLTPMLAGLLELIPWVKQWHNEPSEEFGGLRMGDYYEQFLDGECRLHGLTHDDLRAWRPTKKPRGTGKAAAKAKAAKADDEEQTGSGHAEEAVPAPKKPRAKTPRAAAKEPLASEEAE